MKTIRVPICGTVISRDPPEGDPKDPLRPCDIDFGNVSWRMVSIDVDKMTMVIEVTAADKIAVPVVDNLGKPVLDKDTKEQLWVTRVPTDAEKTSYEDFAEQAAAGAITAKESLTPAPVVQPKTGVVASVLRFFGINTG